MLMLHVVERVVNVRVAPTVRRVNGKEYRYSYPYISMKLPEQFKNVKKVKVIVIPLFE